MTRQKKSRKPGTLGVKSKPKNLRERAPVDSTKKSDKTKGKPAGNRHSATAPKRERTSASKQVEDPRVGSKRKIALTPSVKAPVAPAKPAVAATAKPTEPAVETRVDPAIRMAEDEFARLENDPRLQDLLAQMDAGDTVSPDDEAWVEQQLERYRQLAAELGIDVDEYGDDDDDDDLEPWQRFENPKDWV